MLLFFWGAAAANQVAIGNKRQRMSGSSVIVPSRGKLSLDVVSLRKTGCRWHDGVYFIKSLTCRGSFGCSQAAQAADVASVSRCDG